MELLLLLLYLCLLLLYLCLLLLYLLLLLFQLLGVTRGSSRCDAIRVWIGRC